jgi:hypothetical protein
MAVLNRPFSSLLVGSVKAAKDVLAKEVLAAEMMLVEEILADVIPALVGYGRSSRYVLPVAPFWIGSLPQSLSEVVWG